MIPKFFFVLAILLPGCSVATVNAAGAKVEVAANGDGCDFLGTVSGSEGMNARTAETNMEAVQAELRNEAAEKGGNRLVVTSQQLGSDKCPNCVTMMGSVYRCSKGSTADKAAASATR